MRAHDPLPLVETDAYKPVWICAKHADILEVERQHDRFLNTARSVLQRKEIEQRQVARGAQLRTLINMDEPDHTRFRNLTKDWFMPNNLKKVEGRVQAIAKAAVDHMLEMGPEIDFVRDVAIWYPLRVIMMILGVPEEDEPRMLQLTQELFGADDPDLRRGEATPEDRDAVIIDFMRYFTQMTADRRAHPGDDVATVIANARIDGEPIGDLEAMSYYVILATAGHDTTSSSTAGGLLALLEHPDEFQRVRDDPSMIPTAIDETVRWVTPVKHFLRYATEDYELRGKVVQEGDAMMMLYPSANRDEDVFDEPFRFIADRRPNRHLAFGHGAHHCLGHLLAKMEMRHLYGELFRRVERIELVGEPRLAQSLFVGGLKTLPIRFTPM
ncbi:MAG: cytochrome P450 [Gammaproteobacteria bacterium]|nr:cytochrome P450 [Gammaproteobacteria bacterium]